MFLEMSAAKFAELKKLLEKMGIKYESSDASRPWDKVKMLHIELLTPLSEKEIFKINEKISEIHNAAAIKSHGLTPEMVQEAEVYDNSSMETQPEYTETTRDTREQEEDKERDL